MPPTVTTAQPPEEQSRSAERASGDARLIGAWAVSLGVHIILFIVMVLIPWITRTEDPPQRAQVPEAQIDAEFGEDVHVSMAQDENPFSRSQENVRQPEHVQPERRQPLDQVGPTKKSDLSVIGIGTGGDEFSEYGLSAGSGGDGPSFFGLGRQARGARRIVYVVDRSGSMLEIFSSLQKELKRSIGQLRRTQKFHVIFFSTGEPVENTPRRLVNAVLESKENTFAFIDSVRPEGGTDPIEAMRRAFQLKPDLIYFLSDGKIDVADELRAGLREWNAQEQVQIFTIAYVNAAGSLLLEEIAREHNGKFKFVSEYDLE